MRHVIWSDDALSDYDAAIGYVARDNVVAAERLASRIETAIDSLAERPIGRPGRVDGTYEKLVLGTSHVVVYSLTDRTITILRLIHTSRNWPDGGWPE